MECEEAVRNLFIYAHLHPQRAEVHGFVKLRAIKSVCKEKRRNTFILKNSILLYKYLLSSCYVRHSVRDRKYQVNKTPPIPNVNSTTPKVTVVGVMHNRKISQTLFVFGHAARLAGS